MNRQRFHSPTRLKHQDGAALAISLILLVIITLLSVSAMRSTNIDTKISVNYQFKEASFQAAENALATVTPATIQVPLTPDAPPVTNTDYFTSTGVTDQPDVSADVVMTYIGPTRAYKVSGYRPNTLFQEYQADAIGTVGDTGTRTQNRMQLLIVRE
ncbi:MAG: PilX N-terminal domain-containing pilus assembly protein [Candidatus Thiodiazotropha sp.]